MVKRSGLWSPSKSVRLTCSHFLTQSTILQGTGGIPSVTTTVGGFEGSTTKCTAKVSTRLMGAEANVVLSKTVGVVALREGSTGSAAWTSKIPEGVPVMEHDTV